MSDETKKKGFFARTFGRKSKEDKQAEEAAERAAAQKRVNEDMAARMAAINAAALKSARQQDLKDSGIDLAEDDAARLEAEDKAKAEDQARKDVEAAQKLAAEKRAKELEAQRLAEAEAAFEKSETERKAREAKIRAEAEALAAQEKAKAEARRKAEEAAQLKAAKDAEAAATVKAKIEAEEAARRRAEEAAAQAAKQEAARRAAEDEAARRAALERRKEEAAAKAAKDAAAAEALREAQAQDDARIAEALAVRRAAEQAERESREGGFLTRISKGLSKSTSQMSENMAALFKTRKLDDEAIQDLEDLLIGADLGVGPSMKVAERLAKDRFDKEVTDTEVKIALADVISDILTPLEKPLILSGAKPEIILFTGVNGSGKTTTLGKLAKRYRDQGKKVLLCAGDTFRAAAVEQLKVWGERADALVVSGKLGSDAASLVYDAIHKANEEHYDVLMIDTAGRLQNRTELMDELAKVVRVIQKHDASAPHHSILVLDATVGQNALLQTEAFQKTAGVTGLIMTKLDGTAKGGVLVALSDKFGLPIHAIGIGERIEDLENFSAPVFAAALSGLAQELDTPDSNN
jgi:fused signal recognition particle receptor